MSETEEKPQHLSIFTRIWRKTKSFTSSASSFIVEKYHAYVKNSLMYLIIGINLFNIQLLL